MTYTDIAKYNPFLFIRNFVSKEDLDNGHLTTAKGEELVAIVHSHNEDVGPFFLNDEINIKLQTIGEDTMENPVAHRLMPHNIDKHHVKWYGVVNISDHRETIGGDWKCADIGETPYRDNFGDLVGDPDKPHIPSWASDFGTLIVYPFGSRVGWGLCTRGPVQRIEYHFMGVWR